MAVPTTNYLMTETTATSRSSLQTSSPRLSGRKFMIVLVLLCILPVATIAIIWSYLPKTEEGKLKAKFTAIGLPPPEYYLTDYRQREPHAGGELLVTNISDQEWTNLSITINGAYQVFDIKPVRPGETVSFELKGFVSRSGARFSLQYNELKSALIYARLPTKNRATFYYEFDTVEKGTRK
jgi:hypothetical protein